MLRSAHDIVGRCGRESAPNDRWRRIGVAACERNRMGSGRRRVADFRNRARHQRRRDSGRRGDRHQDGHRTDSNRVHRQRRLVRADEPAGGAVPIESRPAGVQHLRPRRHRAAGEHEPRDQRHVERRRHQRTGDRRRELEPRRGAQHRRRTGDRQSARPRDAAERPAGYRVDLSLRSRDRRSQQEFPNGHDLGGRRPGQRHHLHHGRRHAQ